jgi:hypothetical protein
MGFTRHRNGPWLGRVLELPMTAFGRGESPTVSLEQLNDLSKFHAGLPSSRLQQLFFVELGNVYTPHGFA